MDFLKKYWPTPFKVNKGDAVSLVVQVLVLIIVCAVVGILIGVLAGIPLIGIIFSIIGALVEAYGLVGIILCVLKFLGKI